MKIKSLQEENLMKQCFGCGCENEHGLKIKSYWQGDNSVCTWEAKPYYTGGKPGIVYGGMLASLIDCHSVNTTISHAYKIENRSPGSDPVLIYLTAQLNISYKKPTAIEKEIVLKAKVTRVEGKKTWVECTVSSDNQICVEGKVLAIRVTT